MATWSRLYGSTRRRYRTGWWDARAERATVAPASQESAITDPYPLLFEPILKEKVWGGDRLARYGKDVTRGARIGESWEVADLAATAPSGGGGGSARSSIVNGPMGGRTLHDAVRRWGPDLLGAGWTGTTAFPLLVKLIDAREPLSIQVHPTPAYAQRHPEAHVKTESWYVLAADPGAHLLIGARPGVEAERIAAAPAELPELMQPVPAHAGDCHHIPSGTVHAIGGGITLAEIQTASDTTFRLYDWAGELGRDGRPLHLTEALEALTLDEPPPPVRLGDGERLRTLVTTDAYTLTAWRLPPEPRPFRPAAATVLLVTSGLAAVTTGAGWSSTLAAGATILVPAGCRVELSSPDDALVLTATLGGSGS